MAAKAPKHPSQEIQDEMVAAYLAGATLEAAAKQFGYCATTCYNALKRRGIPRRRRGRGLAKGYPSQKVQDAMIAAYLTGASLRESAKQFDYSYETCRHALIQRGIPRRAKSKLSPEYLRKISRNRDMRGKT